jgi:DNA-binding beta-propeller fold protein YncE
MKKILFCGGAILLLAASVLTGQSALGAEYHSLGEIQIGGTGRFDYLAMDAAARRLYVSHGGSAVVIDVDQNKVVGEVTNTPGIHGIAIAHDLGRGFTSDGHEAKASVFDLNTLATLSKVDTGENPDCIVYEPSQKEVYTFNGHADSATVFEAMSGKVVATIPLPGKPEFAVADTEAGRIYDNLEDKSTIVTIGSKTHQVLGTWPIAPGEEASGMALDAEHHRLFIGCHNELMEMIDSASGKVIATVPIGKGVDANAFDPGTQLAFSSNGEGNVTIAHEDSPDKLTVVQTLTTMKGARTIALDTKTHRIYLSVGSGPTFKVLIYGME